MWTSKHVVNVGGCGHVGLPLDLLFASRGVKVTLLDIDKSKVEKVNGGEIPYLEPGAPELLQQVVGKGLEATLDGLCLARADIFIPGALPSVYQSLSYPSDKQAVDVWNFWAKSKDAHPKVHRELLPLKESM